MIKLYDKKYETSADIQLVNGKIPLTYWKVAPNFGDLLSPYLINKLTNLDVKYVYIKPGHLRPKKRLFKKAKHKSSYLAIGSISSRTTNNSIVWGSGTFGTEDIRDLGE